MSDDIHLVYYLNKIKEEQTNYKGSGLPKFQKYRPRKFPISFSKNCELYEIQSIDELKNVILNKYNDSITLPNIIKLYCDFRFILTKDLTLFLNVNEVYSVREYNRDRNIYCSKRTPQLFDELVEDIQYNGIQTPGRIKITHKYDHIDVILCEGNHRLAIAKQLTIPVIPIKFEYVS